MSTTDGRFQTITSAAGYFVLDALPSGIYDVLISPPVHSRRLLRSVVVSPGQATDLGEILLSQHPYPIHATSPVDGAENQSRFLFQRNGIMIYVDEALNVDDLNAHTVFTPEVPGIWTEHESVDSGLHYSFGTSDATVRARYGETYRLIVESAVRIVSGGTLGVALVLEFSIGSPSVHVRLPYPRLRGVPIEDFYIELDFGGYDYYYYRSDCFPVDSLKRAVTLEPVIEGDWLPYIVCNQQAGERYANGLRFVPFHKEVPPATHYRLIIRSDVNLGNEGHLARPDTTEFVTEPYGLVAVQPGDGGETNPGRGIILVFNTTMDTGSVAESFSLTSIAGERASGSFWWTVLGRAGEFDPDPPLKRYTIYTAALTGELLTSTGDIVYEDFVWQFSVR